MVKSYLNEGWNWQPSTITVEIFNDLFNKEQRNELTKQTLLDVGLLQPVLLDNYHCCCTSCAPVGEHHQPVFPDGFPPEIESPVIKDSYDKNNVYGNQEWQVEETNDEGIILGSYSPMSSPGIITFNRENIKKYSGSLIRKVLNSGISLGLDTALFTIYFIVQDVMDHELFHYYSDYKRQLTGAKFDRDKEEALAVAHSFKQWADMSLDSSCDIFDNSEYEDFFFDYFQSKLSERRRWKIFEFLYIEHYKGFTARGYRDWHLYIGDDSYKIDYFNYLKNSKLDAFLENGIPVNEISREIKWLGNHGATILLK